MSPIDYSKDIERHDAEINDLWSALNAKVDGIYEHMDRKFGELSMAITNRLPPWVTFVIALQSGMLASALTAIGFLLKFALD